MVMSYPSPLDPKSVSNLVLVSEARDLGLNPMKPQYLTPLRNRLDEIIPISLPNFSGNGEGMVDPHPKGMGMVMVILISPSTKGMRS